MHAVNIQDEAAGEHSLHGIGCNRERFGCEGHAGRLVLDSACQASPSAPLDRDRLSCSSRHDLC